MVLRRAVRCPSRCLARPTQKHSPYRPAQPTRPTHPNTNSSYHWPALRVSQHKLLPADGPSAATCMTLLACRIPRSYNTCWFRAPKRSLPGPCMLVQSPQKVPTWAMLLLIWADNTGWLSNSEGVVSPSRQCAVSSCPEQLCLVSPHGS